MTDILTTKRLVIIAVAAKCWLIFSSLTEMLLEIGFIEQMRTAGGNEEVPKIFFPNLPYSRKYNLSVRLPSNL